MVRAYTNPEIDGYHQHTIQHFVINQRFVSEHFYIIYVSYMGPQNHE